MTSLPVSAGVPGGVMIQRVDVTEAFELRHQCLELKSQSDKWKVVLGHSTDAIAVLDVKGRVQSTLGSFEEVTGYTERAVEGQPLHYCLASPGTEADALAAVDDCLQLMCGCDAEFECSHKDGALYQGRTTIRPLTAGAHEQLLGFVAYHRDVTDEVRRERHRQELQKQLADAARRAASAAMTHSALEMVAESLNSASVQSGLVMNRLRSFAPSRLEQAGTLIEENLHDLQDFIQNNQQGQHLPEYLKSLASRISRENQILQEEILHLQEGLGTAKELVKEQQRNTRLAQFLEPVNVNNVIREALLAVPMEEGVELEEALNDQLPAFYGDRRRVMQVAVNLLSNARHAIAQQMANGVGAGESYQPKVTLRTWTEDDGRTLVAEIGDNGCGIASEDLPRVFRRGFSTWEHGRGYGLYCSHQVAGELGGRMSAFSEGESQGAVVRLELPLRSAVHSSAPYLPTDESDSPSGDAVLA